MELPINSVARAIANSMKYDVRTIGLAVFLNSGERVRLESFDDGTLPNVFPEYLEGMLSQNGESFHIVVPMHAVSYTRPIIETDD